MTEPDLRPGPPLGRLLETRVTRAQLPKAIERFNTGQAVAFGPLSVGPSGITAGDQSLPWSEIEDVPTRNGMVSVKRSGKWLAWKRAQVSQIPNYFIFDALVRAILFIFDALSGRPPRPADPSPAESRYRLRRCWHTVEASGGR